MGAVEREFGGLDLDSHHQTRATERFIRPDDVRFLRQTRRQRSVANIRLDPDPVLHRDHRGFLRHVTNNGRGGMDDDPDPRGGDR